ncbi:MAG: hypothetical protein MZV64_23500 [Ignavibacteriales bacterium]|nr:hypothetical protein [Ignavibacteriales bacterium]
MPDGPGHTDAVDRGTQARERSLVHPGPFTCHHDPDLAARIARPAQRRDSLPALRGGDAQPLPG